MYRTLLVIFFIVSTALIAVIILQQDKGYVGTSFGVKISNKLILSNNSVNLMTRTTTILAILFFIISLALGSIDSNQVNKGGKWRNLTESKKDEKVCLTNSIKLNNNIPL